MTVEAPTATGTMEILRPYGHAQAGDEKVQWNKNDDIEVHKARKVFDDWLAKGGFAYRAEGKDFKKGEMLKTFDPNAERIVLVPKMVGG